MRRASSVILRRGNQIYLAQRSPSLPFFGGFWACVGGKVSPVDDADAQRTTLPELPFDLQPFAVAAMRELFEELALELSDHPMAHPEEARQALLAGASLVDQIGDDRVRAASLLQPVLRIQTPEYHPIRFDTQFFLLDWADLPHGPEPRIACDELAESRWADPSEWMACWRAGEILIAPPVLLVLQRIAAHGWDPGLAAIEQLERELSGWTEDDSELELTDDDGAKDEGAVDPLPASHSLRTGTSDANLRSEPIRSIHPIFYNPAAQLIPLRTPTLPPATHTNCYLVGQDPAYLIDPATRDPIEQERLLAAIEHALPSGVVPERHLRAILLTHHHPDHIGAVDRVREHFGIPVWAHPITKQLLAAPAKQPGDTTEAASAIQVDRTIEDGEVLALGTSPDGKPGWSMRAVFTPGHAAGHLCFLENRYGSLFAGDMVSTLSSILVRRSDGDMTLYMDSLERLTQLPVSAVFPAHGPGDVRGTKVLLEQLAHRRAREASIVSAIEQGAEDIDAIVHLVYQDVAATMHALARLSVESVCVKLARDGRIPTATAERLLA